LVAEVLGELVPSRVLCFAKAGELVDAAVQPMAQLLVAHGDAIHREDREISGHAPILGEVEQGGHEFPPGQVAASAKNDKDSRFELVSLFHISYNFSHSV
jgi:hypothetical protein